MAPQNPPLTDAEVAALKRSARVLALRELARREARALTELAAHIPTDASDEQLISVERALHVHHYQSGVIAIALGVSRTRGE